MSTEDLVAFIEARLAEDERIALAATGGPWRVDNEDYAEAIYAADGFTTVVAGGRWGGEASVFNSDDDARHIARHDPARVLRDVAADRWILKQHEHLRFAQPGEDWNDQDHVENPQAFPGSDRPWVGCKICDYHHNWEEFRPGTWCGYVRRLALPFTDHPGYDPSWSLTDA